MGRPAVGCALQLQPLHPHRRPVYELLRLEASDWPATPSSLRLALALLHQQHARSLHLQNTARWRTHEGWQAAAALRRHCPPRLAARQREHCCLSRTNRTVSSTALWTRQCAWAGMFHTAALELPAERRGKHLARCTPMAVHKERVQCLPVGMLSALHALPKQQHASTIEASNRILRNSGRRGATVPNNSVHSQVNAQVFWKMSCPTFDVWRNASVTYVAQPCLAS